MLDTRPFISRAIVAKGGGAVLGLIVLAVPAADPADLQFRVGVALWLVALGGIVAVMGLFDHHPLFTALRLPWWVRGPVTGLWMALMLILLAPERTAALMQSYWGDAFHSAWWALVCGLFWGGVLDFAATRWAGEGEALVRRG